MAPARPKNEKKRKKRLTWKKTERTTFSKQLLFLYVDELARQFQKGDLLAGLPDSTGSHERNENHDRIEFEFEHFIEIK